MRFFTIIELPTKNDSKMTQLRNFIKWSLFTLIIAFASLANVLPINTTEAQNHDHSWMIPENWDQDEYPEELDPSIGIIELRTHPKVKSVSANLIFNPNGAFPAYNHDKRIAFIMDDYKRVGINPQKIAMRIDEPQFISAQVYFTQAKQELLAVSIIALQPGEVAFATILGPKKESEIIIAAAKEVESRRKEKIQPAEVAEDIEEFDAYTYIISGSLILILIGVILYILFQRDE